MPCVTQISSQDIVHTKTVQYSQGMRGELNDLSRMKMMGIICTRFGVTCLMTLSITIIKIQHHHVVSNFLKSHHWIYFVNAEFCMYTESKFSCDFAVMLRPVSRISLNPPRFVY